MSTEQADRQQCQSSMSTNTVKPLSPQKINRAKTKKILHELLGITNINNLEIGPPQVPYEPPRADLNRTFGDKFCPSTTTSALSRVVPINVASQANQDDNADQRHLF